MFKANKEFYFIFSIVFNFFKAFKVICKSEESFIETIKLLKELISQNHLVKDEYKNDSIKILTKNEVI